MIPQTFDAWAHCITVECGIALERAFIEARLRALADASHWQTQRFVELYGREHLARVVLWFEQARRGQPAGIST